MVANDPSGSRQSSTVAEWDISWTWYPVFPENIIDVGFIVSTLEEVHRWVAIGVAKRLGRCWRRWRSSGKRSSSGILSATECWSLGALRGCKNECNDSHDDKDELGVLGRSCKRSVLGVCHSDLGVLAEAGKARIDWGSFVIAEVVRKPRRRQRGCRLVRFKSTGTKRTGTSPAFVLFTKNLPFPLGTHSRSKRPSQNSKP